MTQSIAAAIVALFIITQSSGCGTDSPEPPRCFQETPGGPVMIPCPDLTPVEETAATAQPVAHGAAH